MEKVKGRNLGVSLLLDPSTQVWTEETAEAPTIISTDKLVKSVAAFKESLKLPTAELTRNQGSISIIFVVFSTQIQDHSIIFWRDFQTPSQYSSTPLSATNH